MASKFFFHIINWLTYFYFQINIAEAATPTADLPSTLSKSETPKEDEVDLELYPLSGNIERERDEKL